MIDDHLLFSTSEEVDDLLTGYVNNRITLTIKIEFLNHYDKCFNWFQLGFIQYDYFTSRSLFRLKKFFAHFNDLHKPL